MLVEHDVFDVFVLDGGAFFFTQDHLGGSEAARWLRAFESGRLLAPWTKTKKRRAPAPRDLDWLGVWLAGRGRWAPGQTIERHVWLNRLYFLLPMAQAWLRTGRRKWARRWFGFLESWLARFPRPERPDASRDHAAALVWHDMQVTWRLLVMIHSTFMLGARPGALSRREWHAVYRAISGHAAHVHAESKRALANSGGHGNHFLQKGTALLYAGLLFPELPGAARWARTGRRVVSRHARGEIYADGGSVEASPSYSHFIARLHLDAYLLLAANRQKAIPGLEGRIAREYSFLEATATPKNRALQVGDSYALDAGRDLALARDFLRVPEGERVKSVAFRASRLAMLRSARAAVYVDAMPGGQWHIHRGKPNLLAWWRGRAVLVDSGGVNYDRPERNSYFTVRAAHNVVVVEPVEKDEAPGKKTTYRLARFQAAEDGGSLTATCRFAGEGTRYAWRRAVSLEGDRLVVTDRVTAPRPVRATLHWHLAASRVTRSRGGGFRAKGKGWTLSAKCASASGRALAPRVAKRPAVDENNRPFQSPDISFTGRGRAIEFTTVFEFGG